jgi:inactivated superfamily I helicase
MRGRIVSVKPKILKQKLKVTVTVHTKKQGLLQAFMPNRELSALLPRCILLSDKKQALPELMPTISAMLKRIALGRTVRVWKYDEHYYFSFISWREVRFSEE